MNTAQTIHAWSADLDHSRELKQIEKIGFDMLLSWFESWRASMQIEPGREAAEQFWKAQVKQKPREKWQLDQWSQAFRWYLAWLAIQTAHGKPVETVAERVRAAVHKRGASRGLAKNTRDTYASRAFRYVDWLLMQSGSEGRSLEKAVLDTENAKAYLEWLVSADNVAYSTQKQALNALVFFFIDVCGMEEVDLNVKFRKTKKKPPIVLTQSEITRVLKQIKNPIHRMMAEVQYGAGLRLNELLRLRIKDVDFEKQQITIRSGKGDKDRVTVLPWQCGQIPALSRF